MSNSVSSKYATFEGLVKAAKDAGYPMHVFVPYNGKFADITHADTNNHSLNIKTALLENRTIVAIAFMASRQSGTGNINIRNASGTYLNGHQASGAFYFIENNTFYYNLSVANDDFDVFCHGYVVEL